MIKLLGFIIILLSTIKIGFELSKKYSDRSNELRKTVSALEIMCKELNFTTSEIGDILFEASKINSINIKRLFKDMARAIKTDLITPFDAFNYCKNNINFALNNDDLQVLSDYFSVCGAGVVEDELNNLNNAISLLNRNIEQAHQDETKYVKLYRFTGVVFGLLIAIIVI